MILRTRSSHRAVRVIAGMVTTLLFAGNVLAAAGLCVMKAPPAVQAASDPPCPQHLVGEAPPAPTAQHCPSDDPSAQARTADLPTAQVIAAAAITPFGSSAVPAPTFELRADTGSPQRPLYARLQRLQL